jgi:hypothetical protein
VAVLEVVVRGPFVVGTWFFEHFVKNAPAGGSSRFLTISSGDKVIGRGLLFALLIFLLLVVVPLRAPARARGILFFALPFVLVAAKDAFSPVVKLVIMSIKPLAVMGVLWPSSRTNSLQVVPERKAMMTSESVILGSSVHCLEKHRM